MWNHGCERRLLAVQARLNYLLGPAAGALAGWLHTHCRRFVLNFWRPKRNGLPSCHAPPLAPRSLSVLFLQRLWWHGGWAGLLYVCRVNVV